MCACVERERDRERENVNGIGRTGIFQVEESESAKAFWPKGSMTSRN